MNAPRSKLIFGLIGYPVSHSLSPVMHNAAFKQCSIDAEYRLFEVRPDKLEDFLLKNTKVCDTKGDYFFSKDITGFNITIPHKVRARKILERAFPFVKDEKWPIEDYYYARLSGAVNTVKREGDKLRYWNTDASGFLRSLREKKFDTKNKSVLIIGCGGAGRAIVASLSWRQNRVNKIYIHDTSKTILDAAEEYFSQASTYFRDSFVPGKLQFIYSSKEISKIIKECHLLINATPTGMEDKDECIIDKNLLHDLLFVYDVVYNRKGKTKLIEDAESLGLSCTGGLSLLLYQGADAFDHWTGKPAPVEVMRDALMRTIQR